MSMKHALGQLGAIDENGIRHLNKNTTGCPFCGTIDIKYSECGTVALSHPGAECCEKRILQQISWRRAEVDEIGRQQQQAVAALYESAKTSTKPINLNEAVQNIERREGQRLEPFLAELRELGEKLSALRGRGKQ